MRNIDSRIFRLIFKGLRLGCELGLWFGLDLDLVLK